MNLALGDALTHIRLGETACCHWWLCSALCDFVTSSTGSGPGTLVLHDTGLGQQTQNDADLITA